MVLHTAEFVSIMLALGSPVGALIYAVIMNAQLQRDNINLRRIVRAYREQVGK